MQDATYWAEQLRQGKISFAERVAMIEEKVNQQNPLLNALVTFDPQAAIQHYEQHLQKTVFGGQPMPLKILGQTKAGWPATSGAKLFAKARASRTAHFVSRLEEVGFVPLGQTNAPEFGFKNITDPTLYGIHVIRGILPIQLVVPVVVRQRQWLRGCFRLRAPVMAADRSAFQHPLAD